MMCNGSCTLPHTTASCTAGVCLVGPCDPGYQDLDHLPQNGCECQVGAYSSSCAMANDQGMIAVGSMHMAQGVLLSTMTSHWLKATFAAGGHPHITLMGGPPGTLFFQVESGCMQASSLMCPDRSQGAVDITAWEFFDNPRDGGAVADAGPRDGGADGGTGRMTPYPTTVYIRVYTNADATDCNPYTLTITN
jgi:hypothetical protein